MNRPSPLTYLVGNPLVCLALVGGAVYMVYQWWTKTDTSSSIEPIVAFFTISIAMKANRQLTAYRDWKKAWDAMSGEPPPRQYPKGLEPWRLISITAIAAMCGVVLWDDSIGSTGLREAAAWVFGISALALTVGGIRLSRRLPRFSRPAGAAGKGHVVTQCLRVPRRSESVLDALSHLPDYCRQVMPRK